MTHLRFVSLRNLSSCKTLNNNSFDTRYCIYRGHYLISGQCVLKMLSFVFFFWVDIVVVLDDKLNIFRI